MSLYHPSTHSIRFLRHYEHEQYPAVEYPTRPGFGQDNRFISRDAMGENHIPTAVAHRANRVTVKQPSHAFKNR